MVMRSRCRRRRRSDALRCGSIAVIVFSRYPPARQELYEKFALMGHLQFLTVTMLLMAVSSPRCAAHLSTLSMTSCGNFASCCIHRLRSNHFAPAQIEMTIHLPSFTHRPTNDAANQPNQATRKTVTFPYCSYSNSMTFAINKS